MNRSDLAITLFKRLARFQYRDVGISVDNREFYCVNVTVTLLDGTSLKSSGLDSSFSQALIKALVEVGEHYLLVKHKLDSTSGMAGGLTSYTAKKRAEWEFIERLQVERLLRGETSLLKIGIDENMELYQFTEQINGAKTFLGIFLNGDYQNFTTSCDRNEDRAIEHIKFVLKASARDCVFSYPRNHIEEVLSKCMGTKGKLTTNNLVEKIRFDHFDSPFAFIKYYQVTKTTTQNHLS